jgi:uncharacterized protein
MATFTAWVRAHPVRTFLVWFFLVGWGLLFVPVVARVSAGAEVPAEPFILASTLFALLAPALVLTRVADGREGLRALVRRWFAVRRGPGWWALALLALPGLALLLAVVLWGWPERTGELLAGGLLIPLVISFLLINLWEETGWMGFVQARLQPRLGALPAALAVAPLFALQHLPLLFVPGQDVLVGFATVLAVAVPHRIVVGWLYNRTSSLFLVGLFHAAFNATNGAIWLPELFPGERAELAPPAALVFLAVVALAASRGRLGLPADGDRSTAAVAGPQEARPVSAR